MEHTTLLHKNPDLTNRASARSTGGIEEGEQQVDAMT